MSKAIRYCADIGLYVLDRAVWSCNWKTTYCAEHCYNNKLYKVFRKMFSRDSNNETFFLALTPKIFKSEMERKRKDISRFRFCARGEPFSDMKSFNIIREVALSLPNMQFKIPTRAWRNDILRNYIYALRKECSNVHILASIDPSNSYQEVLWLHQRGFKTFFFGNDKEHPLGKMVLNPVYKCPKTWEHKKGYCIECKDGCFNKEVQHIWLKQH